MKVGASAEPSMLPAGPPVDSAVATSMTPSRKAQLRQVALRKYAGLRSHAQNCTDCVPGATDAEPPRVNRVCRVGMAGKADYEQAYERWVSWSEEGS